MSHVFGFRPHPEWVVEVGLWDKIPARTPTIKHNSCLLKIQSLENL